MREEAVPEMDGEIGCGGAKARDKMVFEGADGAFGGVAAVGVGWNKLVFHVLLFHPVLLD